MIRRPSHLLAFLDHFFVYDEGAPHELPTPPLIPFADLSPHQLAQTYLHAAWLEVFSNYLTEQFWIWSQNHKKANYELETFLESFVETEMLDRPFFKGLFLNLDPKHFKRLAAHSKSARLSAQAHLTQMPAPDQSAFFQTLIELLALEFERECKVPLRATGQLSLYRTFDSLDKLFGIDYSNEASSLTGSPLPQNSLTSNSQERAYLGSGAGVQTSYSTLFSIFRHVSVLPSSRIVDLGSGFGRLGFVCGLLHPECHFAGFELVQSRVDHANQISKRLQIERSVQFICQDLGLDSFRLPDADLFYLFDPFTEQTYQKVMHQIQKLGRQKCITVVTKGNARSWLERIATEDHWPKYLELEGGNVCIFKSEPGLR